MQMHPVSSSAIEAIGHDPETNTLRVRFKRGGEYEYPEVSADEHEDFRNAGSIGRHFLKHFAGRRNFKKL